MEKRVILYIDILGFKNFLKSKKCNNRTIPFYEELICIFNKEVFDIEDDINQTAYADTIIISLSASDGAFQLGALFKLADEIQFYILHELGLLTRGVIHLGKLRHNDKGVIGEALADAYEFECKIPFPAIYVSDSFAKEKPKKKAKRKGSENFTEYTAELESFFECGVLNSDPFGAFIAPKLIFSEEHKIKSIKIIEAGRKKAKKQDQKAKWIWLKQRYDEISYD